MKALLALAVLLPATAQAQDALHTQAFYASNPRLRQATLGWCHSYAGDRIDRSSMADCVNAEGAANNARLASRGDPLSLWDRAQYWSDHPQIRAGVLRRCQHPNDPGVQMYLRYCRVAQTAQSYGGWVNQ